MEKPPNKRADSIAARRLEAELRQDLRRIAKGEPPKHFKKNFLDMVIEIMNERIGDNEKQRNRFIVDLSRIITERDLAQG